MGGKLGFDQAKIAAISSWRGSELFTQTERDALALADAMADAPATIDDDDCRALLDRFAHAGFDVALQDEGRVLVLDPFRMVVRPFTPKETAATT